MAGEFSGVIRLSEVDDYIAPSQNCVLPLTGSGKKSQNSLAVNVAKKKSNAQNAVKITLTDCLACSGCITTAETILISQQSADQLKNALRNSELCVVVTISPQSLASLAVKYSIPTEFETLKRLCAFLLGIHNVRLVLNSTFGRQLALLALVAEFRRKKVEKTDLPLISSVCPGWVCYAEKTHADLLIRHLSRVRSPQAINGALVKSRIAEQLNISAERIFHASVMPCFDKKLEASRKQLTNKRGTPETDIVVSTAEFEQLIRDDGVNLHEEFRDKKILRKVERYFEEYGEFLCVKNGSAIRHEGGESGGYAERVVQSFLCDLNPPKNNVIVTRKAAKDLEEIAVRSTCSAEPNDQNLGVHQENPVLLSVAKVYGFKNIQNLVHKLKKGKCHYDFVEVMACPSGCINGGGQIRVPTSNNTIHSRKELVQHVSNIYNASTPAFQSSVKLSKRLDDWFDGSVESDKAESLLFTEFHKLDSDLMAASTKW